jgi:anti-sigma factor RsiW
METCKECVDFIIDYIDGRLDPSHRSSFEKHLRRCPPCVNYLESYRQTVMVARKAGEAPQPIEVPEALVQAILASRNRCTPPHKTS